MRAATRVQSDSWLDRVGESFARGRLNEVSPKTVRSYGQGLKNLFAFLRSRGVEDLHYVTPELLQAWQDSMRERVPPLRAGSRAIYSTAARQLIKWAAERGIVDVTLEAAIKGVRTRRSDGRTARPAIGDEDLAKLIEYLRPRRPRMSVIDLRDRALFYFLLATGLQISEALQVTRTNYEKGRLRQTTGTYVEFETPTVVVEFIRDYLRARRDELPWLWIKHGNNTNVSGPLEDSGVREAWARICFHLEIERFNSRQLRRTSAGVLLDAGIDGATVAKHLNHANSSAIRKFAKVRRLSQEKTVEVMDRVIQASGTSIEDREARNWWVVHEGAVISATGYEMGPASRGEWWFPSLGWSMHEGRDIFPSASEARATAIHLLVAERDAINRKVDALELEELFSVQHPGKLVAGRITGGGDMSCAIDDERPPVP
ncbi:MAG: tyrosine-type recombinase/integrase [Candidatus Dormibacteraceae bacterium]